MRVRVVFSFRTQDTYDYTVPADCTYTIQPGTRVEAPLGNSIRSGYVIECDPPLNKNIKYRNIKDVLDTRPPFSAHMMELADFISTYYYCPLGLVFKAILPAPVRARNEDSICVHVVRPALSCDELTEKARKMQKRAPRQADALVHLVHYYSTLNDSNETIPLRLSELVARADTTTQTIRALEKKELLTVTLEKIVPPLDNDVLPTGNFTLNDAQKNAISTISNALDSFTPFLLYGVTGSGKTEVYLQIIRTVIEQGKTALVLVPEIALTPQTVDRFKSRFAAHVAVQHSNLSDAERCRQWWHIRDGHASIVVGARSAVFAPLDNIGVIVVDEEHESSYKQADPAPRYHARDIAVMRAKMSNCPVILGSATPSLESYANVKRKKYTLLELPERVGVAEIPVPRLVNLREEQRVAPQLGVISRPLREELTRTLKADEQAVLFLNRRGYCPIIACSSCGYVKSCESCAVSLTYHKKQKVLKCHLCEHTEPYQPPYHCPECKTKLSVTGFGTQRVEQNIAYLFPYAKVGRMDRDTTTKKGSHERILSAFGRGEFDILLGTQMIAKGLDYPNVTLVGVINADVGLHAPDFRATETTFQLITQVAGRAGRGIKPGKVIIQSFTPGEAAIIHAVKGEWRDFAKEELELRKTLMYPPYSHLIYIIVRGKDEEKVTEAAGDLTRVLGYAAQSARKKHTVIIDVQGPAPAPLARAHGYHRWQIMVRTQTVMKTLSHVISPVLKRAKYSGVTLHADVDPY